MDVEAVRRPILHMIRETALAVAASYPEWRRIGLLATSGSNQTGFTCYSQFDIREGSGIVIMTNGKNGSELWSRLISAVGDL